LALLVAYGLGIASFFVVSPLIALSVWVGAGIFTGVLYGAHEYWIAVRHTEPDDPPRFGFGHLLFGPLAWPLMFMEVIENTYAEFYPHSGNSQPPAEGDA